MTVPSHILPAEASPTGNYRGISTWAERPLTFNAAGDTLRISDQGLLEYVWSGTGWVNPDTDGAIPDLTAPGPIGGTTPDAGTFTVLTAANVAATAAEPVAANSTGTKGEIRSADGFIYLCIATDTWQRVAIATWP